MQEKVTTKAITVKKVRGDVNPADLFTKHLPSREKLHQLVGLFGCYYREGRPEAAPLLRPQAAKGRQGAHPPIDEDEEMLIAPAFALSEEQEVHDVHRLPHMHSPAEEMRYFPAIKAAAEPDNANDWQPSERLVAGV